MYYKGRSRIVATYSKRKQFVRVIRDNWRDAQDKSIDNVFDIPKPLTSTPIQLGVASNITAKNDVEISHEKPLKPLNLLRSGSFDSVSRYSIENISHPRQLTGKRACRRSPLLNVNEDVQPSTCNQIDASADLFASLSDFSSQINTTSAVNHSVSQPVKSVVHTEYCTEIDLNSRTSKEFNESDFVTPVICHAITDNDQSSTVDSNISIMDISLPSVPTPCPFSPAKNHSISDHDKENVVQNVDHELANQLDLSNMSISKEQKSPLEQKSSLEMSVQQKSVLDMSVGQTSMVLETSTKQKSSLEISIAECVSEQKVAPLDRSLLLDTHLPSLTKLLSQCHQGGTLQQLLESQIDQLRKIGEGSFGEVFMGVNTVYKIIPVGGDVEINDVEQTSFENAFQEIVVSRKLSDLSGDEVQMGKAFCQLKDVIFCKGRYPEFLLEIWDNFQGSENERPDTLPDTQLYVVLLSKYSGVQLEDYCKEHKLTPDQAHSTVRQITCSLAAAEQKFEFEHRDLHWGNVLIMETDTKLVEFTQNGQNFILKSHGLLATIIDFTFSRLETDGCLNFVELEHEDWLFKGDVKVDIQYRVYRDMRSACRKNWAKFTPKTNVLWLLYLIDKMNIRIKSPKLRRLRQSLQSCKSASSALDVAFRSL